MSPSPAAGTSRWVARGAAAFTRVPERRLAGASPQWRQGSGSRWSSRRDRPREGTPRPGAARVPVERPPPAADDGCGSGRPRCPRASRRRRPLGEGGRCRRRGSAAIPGRLDAGGPERGPRRSHGRERARSGREPLPPAGAARPEHGATSPRAHADAKAMGLGALAVVRLIGALQRRASSRWPRADRSGGPRGRRKRPSVGPEGPLRNAERSLGKTSPTPCRARITGATLRASLGHGLPFELPR
jgi:hypothetical protein